MKLSKIQKITGHIELLTGLHIGSGNSEIDIGGADNPVIRNPSTQQPYIPGSSIKGKMRSLLEWQLGVVGLTQGYPLGFKHLPQLDPADETSAKMMLKLFGSSREGVTEALAEEIGPSRLSFWDCPLDPGWVEEMGTRNLLLTEVKMENAIDRIKGTAEYPRHTERVPANARFDFVLSLRVHDDEDLLGMLLSGLKLLEISGLGGSGSRGYGKIAFRQLQIDGEDLQTRLDALGYSEVA